MVDREPWRRLGYAGIAFVIVVSVAVWLYALVLSHPKPVDSLDDPGFARSAQPICASAVQRLHDAGLANKVARSPADRAEIASRADAVVAQMVDDLGALIPAGATDRRIVTAWLGDWRAWLEDRAKWEAQLRIGRDGPFYERQRKTGEPNSEALDKLANNNAMPACTVPAGI